VNVPGTGFPFWLFALLVGVIVGAAVAMPRNGHED